MPRKATGTLQRRPTGWYGQYWATVDGERVRLTRALGTHNRAVAKRKLAKLVAAAQRGEVADATAAETFEEAAERVYQARVEAGADDPRGPRAELASLRHHAFETIGPIAVDAITPKDINSVLDAGKDAGLARQSVQHLRQRMANVFEALRREGAVTTNPVREASMPKFGKQVRRERAVLTDHELAVYLSWEHPLERFQEAARERQVMACVSRMFGGLRTGDLHALRWEAFDTEGGSFATGYAPRQKTKRPQLLEVPETLRPFLRDWWERAGRPSKGLVFPVRRIGKRGDRVGDQRRGVSHADAFRRDLRRAFRAAPEGVAVPQGPALDAETDEYGPDSDGDKRWRELFTETDYTLPVDFHSWRRAYVQALADADVNAQQAAALAGHADLGAHMRYLFNASKARRLPDSALPTLDVVSEKHLPKAAPSSHEALSAENAEESVSARVNENEHMRFPVLLPKPKVVGSNPTGSAIDIAGVFAGTEGAPVERGETVGIPAVASEGAGGGS